MDVSSMLSNGGTDDAGASDNRRQSHQYPTRHGSSAEDGQYNAKAFLGNAQRSLRGNNGAAAVHGPARGSPAKKEQKHVVFQLIDPKDPRIQARLPMRVMISPHDTMDSIVNTVKNFYGLYDFGVSFENKDGISIIANYKNFENNMTVYVRTVEQAPTSLGDQVRDSASPKKLGAPFEMRPPSHSANQSPSRSGVRSLGARSMSPQSDAGRRSASVAPGGKPRTHRTKSKDNSMMGDAEGYSSGNDESGSVASSRRSKVDDIKADITVDNIVEGGRRKRAFESSELPLFVPPQVPMTNSISSISPQRRSGHPNAASPYAYSNQQTFSYTQPLPSPQSYSNGVGSMQPPFPSNPYQNGFQQPSRQLRGSRMSGASYGSNRHSNGGVLPTPDPTIGSVISDEDVALQLMRLGDPTAFSHGRTSTSTVDDALSGKADAASSDEGSDDDDEEDEQEEARPPVPRFSKDDVGPQRKKQRLMNELPSDGTSGEEYEDHRDGTFGSDDVEGDAGQRKPAKPKSKVRSNNGAAGGKPGKPRALSMSKVKKTSIGGKMPMSPASLPSQSRKASISSSVNLHNQFGDDEEDLSSKPRCQRCRKSKKGCDRQRPCGRCKDAGIGAEGCISEDEGNGRKGRYGRHMGVPIKKSEDDSIEDDSPPAQQAPTPANGYFLAPALPDKNKQNSSNNNNNKRKR